MTKVAASRVRVTTFRRVARSRERVVVRDQGKDCAVIVPLEDLELIEQIENEIDRREAKKILARIRRGEEKTYPYEKVQHELGLA